VSTEDVFAEDLGVKLPGFRVVTSETFWFVRDFKSTINSTLEDGEYLGPSGCAYQTDVEKNQERSALSFNFLDKVVCSITCLGISSVDSVKVEFFLKHDEQPKDQWHKLRRSCECQP